MPILRSVLLVLCLSIAAAAVAAPPVQVVALFKGRAVIRAAGGTEQLLKVGETSPEGVTLLQADSATARVRYRGEVYDLTLSRQVSSRFHEVERQRVSISADGQGQYRIRGAINDTLVDFLVDTGASVVAMSRVHAAALGLNVDGAGQGTVQTAQGTASSHFVTLDKVVVGGLTAYNVRAAVIDGDYPAEILLGMSFLHQVSMQENGGVLTLTEKR